ncbi:MAG: bifunctional phosphopantothenoylcysteine decarboxylase/phosphopantothenate--cysteine ligase CoaBC [Nitrososphaera sp.]
MTGKRQDHPSKDITGTEGVELGDRKIVLCITGSVAAYRAIDLARLLMRHGADVHAVMTESTASLLLTPDMMKWATGNEVVTKLTGNLEHIMLADYGMSDLIVVYPCTANTIGKMANGIDDTSVTSVLSVALGSKIPIIIAPAMHEAMYGNNFIRQNVQKLREHGVILVEPNIEEGKAKVAEPARLLDAAIKVLSVGPLSGKRVLVTAGSTIEHIDPIRVISNMSSGRMGLAIAREAKKMGASVTLVYGHGDVPLGELADGRVRRVGTGKEMYEAVMSELRTKYDIVIMAAAVSDFAPARSSEKKIDSRIGSLNLALAATKKIIDEIKKVDKDIMLVAFKADYGVSHSALVDKAFRKLQECNADIVVANDLAKKGSGAGSEKNDVILVDRQKKVIHLPLQDKDAVARKLLEIVASNSRK